MSSDRPPMRSAVLRLRRLVPLSWRLPARRDPDLPRSPLMAQRRRALLALATPQSPRR